MNDEQQNAKYSVEQAIRAQRALRKAAGLGEELFPVQAFVGMISDEIQVLREQGRTDVEISELIEANSSLKIKPSDISESYATPEQRRRGHSPE